MLRRSEIYLVLVDFGIGGMLDAWTDISSGWIWLGVTIVGATGLLAIWVSDSKGRRRVLKTREPDPEQVKRLNALSVVARAIRERAMENPTLDKMVDEVLKKEERGDD